MLVDYLSVSFNDLFITLNLFINLRNYEELKGTKKWKALKSPALMKIIDAMHYENSHWILETRLQ